jgi:hypothetical protein
VPKASSEMVRLSGVWVFEKINKNKMKQLEDYSRRRLLFTVRCERLGA